MKEKFEDRKLTGSIKVKLSRNDINNGYWITDKFDIISKLISIVTFYTAAGYKLTLRQLYYQLVAKDWIPNDMVVYNKLSALLDDCRYSGEIDWDAFEDRGRVPYTPYFEDSITSALERTKDFYSLDKRKNQPIYVELWTEKDAISSILKNAVHDFTITVGINKGFASSTAIYAAYKRFIKKILLNHQKVVILYFGDHDPSGLDMVRDIKERLEFMMSHGTNQSAFLKLCGTNEIKDLLYEYDLINQYNDNGDREKMRSLITLAIVKKYFEVKHIGLTKEQIEEYNLPSNPAKLTDPRAVKYIKKHGNISWEVDALQPDALERIITENLNTIIDQSILDNILEQEENDRDKLGKIIDKIKE
jgi:hypothetical protein